MTDLPETWEAVPLDALCDFNPKHHPDTPRETVVSFVPMPSVSEVSGAIVETTDRPLSEVWKGFTHFQDGDVLFAKITPCMENGKAAVAQGLSNGLGCGSTEFHVLRPFQGVDPRYVWYFLRQEKYRKDAEQAMTGAVGQRRVPADYVKASLLPTAPTNEQRRIVEQVDGLLGRSTRARDELGYIPRLIERYKRAVLTQAFRGMLTRAGAPYGRMPISTIAVRVTKGASPKWQGFSYCDEGVCFVRSQNVGWGHLSLADVAYVPEAFNKKQKNSVIFENDVLLNIVGASIGRTAVASREVAGGNCNQAVAIIRLGGSRIDAQYLSLWLMSPEAQAAITQGSVEFARANFSLGEIKKLSVPWPPEHERLGVVKAIFNAFSWIDRIAHKHESAGHLLSNLDQAILAKAFRGEMVPQDPDDEPASALLERIREKRAKQPKPRRGRGKPKAMA